MFCAVLFDLDGTLYDSNTLAHSSRVNAVKAMVESGLDVDFEEAFQRLLEIVGKYGSNYDHHFDMLLESFGRKPDARIIAAGVLAYHETKTAYLVPYPSVIPTLLDLRQKGLKIGVVSNGKPVKQWEKLIHLGLQHFFHTVVIRESGGKPAGEPVLEALEKLGLTSGECLMVGDRVETDVLAAKNAGVKSVLVVRGGMPGEIEPEPDYIITSLKDVIKIIDTQK